METTESNSAVYTCTICSQTALWQTGKHLWAIYTVGFLFSKRSNPSHPITVVWRPPSWTGQILQCKFGLLWHCSFVETSDAFLIQQCQHWGLHCLLISWASSWTESPSFIYLAIQSIQLAAWKMKNWSQWGHGPPLMLTNQMVGSLDQGVLNLRISLSTSQRQKGPTNNW